MLRWNRCIELNLLATHADSSSPKTGTAIMLYGRGGRSVLSSTATYNTVDVSDVTYGEYEYTGSTIMLYGRGGRSVLSSTALQ